MMAKIRLQLLVNPSITYDASVLAKLFQDFKDTITEDMMDFPENYKGVVWIDAYLDNYIEPISGYGHFGLRTKSNVSDNDELLEIHGYKETEITRYDYRLACSGDVE